MLEHGRQANKALRIIWTTVTYISAGGGEAGRGELGEGSKAEGEDCDELHDAGVFFFFFHSGICVICFGGYERLMG